jgi:hypothetical protein
VRKKRARVAGTLRACLLCALTAGCANLSGLKAQSDASAEAPGDPHDADAPDVRRDTGDGDGPGVVPIHYVQGNSNGSLTSPVMTLSCSLMLPATAGNLIVASVQFDAPIARVSDGHVDFVEATNAGMIAIFYAIATQSGTEEVTFDFSSVAHPVLSVHEYGGIAATDPLDQDGGQTGDGTSVSSGSVKTKSPHELIFGYARSDTGIQPMDNGHFHWRQSISGNVSEDDFVSVEGSYDATFTAYSSSDWGAVIATFRGLGE